MILESFQSVRSQEKEKGSNPGSLWQMMADSASTEHLAFRVQEWNTLSHKLWVEPLARRSSKVAGNPAIPGRANLEKWAQTLAAFFLAGPDYQYPKNFAIFELESLKCLRRLIDMSMDDKKDGADRAENQETATRCVQRPRPR